MFFFPNDVYLRNEVIRKATKRLFSQILINLSLNTFPVSRSPNCRLFELLQIFFFSIHCHVACKYIMPLKRKEGNARLVIVCLLSYEKNKTRIFIHSNDKTKRMKISTKRVVDFVGFISKMWLLFLCKRFVCICGSFEVVSI